MAGSHCEWTNSRNCMDDCGFCNVWLTSRRRDSSRARACRLVGKSASVPMISERRMLFRVPSDEITGSLQRATQTLFRFPRSTKLPVWYRRRIIGVSLSPEVRLGSAIPTDIIRTRLAESSTTLPLNEFHQCAFFESEVFADLEVGQLLWPMPSGSLVHPGNGNLQQLRNLVNGEQISFASSLFRCGCRL